MSGSTELGSALRAWRDRTAPAEVGLPSGGVRRAAGLRREELSQLASLSVDYIVRLEQGRATSPSPQVLSSLARALRLSDVEREHLYVLAGQPVPGPGHVSQVIPPGVRRLIDQLDGAPLSVNDAAWNVVLWNPLWAPHFLSRTTLRPFGPSVTFTVSASWLSPRSMLRRATSSKAMILAMGMNPPLVACPGRPVPATDGLPSRRSCLAVTGGLTIRPLLSLSNGEC